MSMSHQIKNVLKPKIKKSTLYTSIVKVLEEDNHPKDVVDLYLQKYGIGKNMHQSFIFHKAFKDRTLKKLWDATFGGI